MFMLNNKKILLGVTGGIAAYKACELIRIFKKNGAEVKVVMTDHAKELVQQLTFEILSQNKIHNKMFGEARDDVLHIELARWADFIIVAPATANIIGKYANGICDDLLSTILIATNAPVCLAPAMNKEMWNKQVVQENIRKLTKNGVRIFGPDTGFQACGEIGAGKMLAPEIIANLTARLTYPPLDNLCGKRILITAGPTIEPLDPARYLSNYSTGTMGYSIAEIAISAGAKVVLLSGPTHLPTPYGVKSIKVKTAKEMLNAVMNEITSNKFAAFISAAAVADYHIAAASSEKIKKTSKTLELKLTKNPDILAEVSKTKLVKYMLGFAAETNDVIFYAKEKLNKKNLDMIVANEIGENKGFGAEANTFTILTKDNKQIKFENMDKFSFAIELLKIIDASLVKNKKHK